MNTQARPFAVVTGASTGIGYELAKLCASNGYEILAVADEPKIHSSAREIAAVGGAVLPLEADLSTQEGVDALLKATAGRQVDVLIANAGRGLGRAFLDQDWADIRRVIDTNVTGTIYLVHELGQQMRTLGRGKILIVGSIAGFMPGTYQAVYNGTKALLDSFSYALRAELADSGVTVTCLMPGATETEFFERADLMDTKYGTEKKMPADEVARLGFEAMLRGDGDVITGWQNKLQAAIARIMPSGTVAKMHEKKAAPGTAAE